MWEIIDDEGVIYSGNEEEVRAYWDKMNSEENEDEWSGDLKLIEIHERTK